MDYEITTASAYDGTSRKVQVIEVFNTLTGKPVSFSWRRPFESKQAWIDRALAEAIA